MKLHKDPNFVFMVTQFLTILSTLLKRMRDARGGGGTIHILGTGTCHREGYRFSRFWYKERYRFHDFGMRNGINFRNFNNLYRVVYAFSENWYKVGYTFWNNWYKERVCF